MTLCLSAVQSIFREEAIGEVLMRARRGATDEIRAMADAAGLTVRGPGMDGRSQRGGRRTSLLSSGAPSFTPGAATGGGIVNIFKERERAVAHSRLSDASGPAPPAEGARGPAAVAEGLEDASVHGEPQHGPRHSTQSRTDAVCDLR